MLSRRVRVRSAHNSGGRRLVVGLVVLTLMGGFTACAETPEAPDSVESEVTSTDVQAGSTRTVELGARPFRLRVPRSYDPGGAAGLVVALHGFGGDADALATRLGLTAASEERSLLLALPEGTPDRDGRQFWNATDACCDVYGAEVDDSTYLSRLIDAVDDGYAVDRGRIFVIGISNGGFMAHRLACDHADLVAAIVSIAGAQSADPHGCNPSRGVSVLEIHGTADDTVLFAGGTSFGRRYPSVVATVRAWRALDGCAHRPGTKHRRLDVDGALPGAETVRTSWSIGCEGGSEVALWKVVGGGHIPEVAPGFTSAVLDWLDAHGRTVD